MGSAPAVLVMVALALLAGCGGHPSGHPDPGAAVARASAPAMPCQSQWEDGLFLTCLRTALDDVWSREFSATGRTYTSAALAVGPVVVPTGEHAPDFTRDRAYFSGNSGIHFPTKYLDDVRAAHGPRAHSVLTFTLGHETGHHVQQLLHTLFRGSDVDVETQADCYAGFWARREADQGSLDIGEFRSGARAELRRLSEDPDEVHSHGNADRRIASLDTGLAATDPEACDTGRMTWR